MSNQPGGKNELGQRPEGGDRFSLHESPSFVGYCGLVLAALPCVSMVVLPLLVVTREEVGAGGAGLIILFAAVIAGAQDAFNYESVGLIVFLLSFVSAFVFLGVDVIRYLFAGEWVWTTPLTVFSLLDWSLKPEWESWAGIYNVSWWLAQRNMFVVLLMIAAAAFVSAFVRAVVWPD